MPTLTRLALGASAVSALTVLGTALPAAAQTPPRPAPQKSVTTRHAGRTATQARTTTKSSAELAREARGAYRSRVLHALDAEFRREAAQRAAAGRSVTTHGSTHRTPNTVRTPTSVRTGDTAGTASARRATRTRVTGGQTSDNWSGYTQSAAELGRKVTSVSASWQVPKASQHTRGQSDMASDWVGIGGTQRNGVSDPTLIQAGTTTTVGRSGFASDYTWFETLPHAAVNTPLATRSGDRMSVAIGRIGSDLWRVYLANATTGRSWSTAVRYRSSSGSADFVTERPRTAAGSVELPNRTATSFRNAKVNGTAVHFRPSQRLTMTDNGRAISTPSGPEARGDGFSVCSYAPSCGAGSR